MTSLTKSFLKRTVLYPVLIGSLAYYFITNYFILSSSDIDPLAFPKMLTDFFEEILYIDISEKVGTIIYFYFFGYLYGLISMVFSLRKLSLKGFRFGVIPGVFWFITSCTIKIGSIILNIMFVPAILLIDIIVSTIRVKLIKKRKSKLIARDSFSFENNLYYEDGHR